MTSSEFGSISQALYQVHFWVGGVLTAVAVGLLLTARPCRSKWFLVVGLALGLLAGAGWYGFSLVQRFAPSTAVPALHLLALAGLYVLHLLADLALLAFALVWKRELEREPPVPPRLAAPGASVPRS